MDFRRLRRRLVETVLRSRGIHDLDVLRALMAVPREEFVDERLRESAYRNAALPIACGQTISQPLMVAIMAQAAQLSRGDRVLEIGSGSGYAAAVLSRIAWEVITIERLPELADSAAVRLHRLGYHNVQVKLGDGTLGWPDLAPFDAIIVSAGAPWVPRRLLEQLTDGGRVVIPVGEDRHLQQLIRLTNRGGMYERENLGDVCFVPLIGQAGWQPVPVPLPSPASPTQESVQTPHPTCQP